MKAALNPPRADAPTPIRRAEPSAARMILRALDLLAGEATDPEGRIRYREAAGAIRRGQAGPAVSRRDGRTIALASMLEADEPEGRDDARTLRLAALLLRCLNWD
jgi:hypothetical protein